MPKAAPKLQRAVPEYVKLRYWGLIKPKPRPTGHLSQGVWKPTQKAYDFLAGKLTVPERIKDFGARSVGFMGKDITVHEVRVTKFDPKHLED